MMLGSPSLADESSRVEAVLKDYLEAMYARDADVAYALISQADKQEKSLASYRDETGNFSGKTLVLARALANEIEFEKVKLTIDGDRANIVFDARIPDANHPDVQSVVEIFNKKRLDGLSGEAVKTRLARLRQMVVDGKLPTMRSLGENWELTREDGKWRVFLNWADAIEVRFEAVVVGNLGWEFEPARRRVLAKPGETIEIAYRARNIGDGETVGKARHIIGPAGDADFMEIISCFCFLEQVLKPGEEAELPLVFRIDFDAPERVKQFNVRYEFFPLAKFPEGAAG